MKSIRIGLQSKLLLAFILVLLIPTIIIVTYNLTTTRRILLDKARPDKLKAIEGQVSSIQSRLLRPKDDLLFLSQGTALTIYLKALSSSSDPSTLNNTAVTLYLQSFLGHTPDIYKDAYILDLTGQEIVGAVNSNGRAKAVLAADMEDQGEQAFFLRAVGLLPGEVFISKVDLNTTHGVIDSPNLPIIRYSMPLFTSDGTITAVLVLKALVESILAAGAASDPNEISEVVEAEGTYLLNPDASRLYGRMLGKNIGLANDLPNEASAILGQPEGTLFGSQDRPDSLQVFARVTLAGYDNIQWTLIHEQPLSNILKEVNDTDLVILALTAVALVIAIGIGILITHSIIHPVQVLTQTAIAIAEGDLSQQVSLGGRDEIGDLARAFNKMSQEVATSHATLEKRVEERTAQLLEAQQHTEEISRAKSTFLSNMSHELRTPLNVIIGYTSSMLTRPQMYENIKLPEVYRSDIQLISTNGHYLVGLINDILDLSKIEAGKFELHPENVDLAVIFRGVIATAVGLLKDKPLQIRPDYPDNLPTIWADPLRVRQIVLNLLSNAIKFTDTGTITLSAQVEGSLVKISVTDTGIGIPEQALHTIFDRFKQAQQDSNKHYGGTGLGLDISKQLAQMHGGDMTVQSVVGQGSTFAFTLPISTISPSVPSIVEQAATHVDQEFKLFNTSDLSVAASHTILLVEDEVSTRNMLRRGLESEGYIVVDTSRGEQAFEIAIGLLPSAIILDVNLPDMSGWEVLKNLKENPDTSMIPIIVCTVSDDSQQASQLGATLYLHKPIILSDLLTHVQKMLITSSNVETGA